MSGTRFQYGSRAGQVAAGVFGAVSVTMAVVGVTSSQLAVTVGFGAATAVFAAMAWRGRRTGLWIGPQVVTVVNLVGTTRIPVADVDHLAVRPVIRDRAVTVVRTDGTEVVAHGFLARSSPASAHEDWTQRFDAARRALAEAQGRPDTTQGA